MNDEELLDDLSRKLKALTFNPNFTQQSISKDLGIDQSTISRLLNRQGKRVSTTVKLLQNYVNMQLEPADLSPEVEKAALEFLSLGGTKSELVASIKHSAQLVCGKLGRRAL